MVEVAGEISNWTDLANFVKSHGDGEWLFRGVTDAVNHSLIPKVARQSLLKGDGSPAEPRHYSEEEEEFYFDMFKRQARPHVVPSPVNELEWLAVAQHHGLPTRLLDWTWSPLVAAYFAVEPSGIKERKRVDAAIYGIRSFEQIVPRTEGKFKKGGSLSSFAFEFVQVYDPPHISPRIPAQRAAFTLHGRPTVPLMAEENRGEKLEKWVIPSTCCYEIKRMLDVCAINRASLFPDLDGLARALEWRYKWAIGYVPPK